jgi:hypothetical protein|tara:strand:- start:13840 stop:14259 length:420 start_codon:yes stop_codon:yes gene_type:complete
MDNNQDPLKDVDLTDEEKALLESIGQKIADNMEAVKKDVHANPDKYLDNPKILQDDPLEPRHITDYDREVYVSLNIEMTAIDENGNFKEISQLLNNSYHIPVASGVDYAVKVHDFVNKFDQGLGDCAQKISIQTDEQKQ